jgi:hypothetical protein
VYEQNSNDVLGKQHIMKEIIMKSPLSKLANLLALIVIMQTFLFAGGREIQVKTKTGMFYVGELLSVRHEELLLSPVNDIDESNLEKDLSIIIRIPSSSVDSIWAEGHSNVGKGMGRGFLIGAGAGAVIGFAGGDDPPGSFFAMSAGGKALVGTILGGGCGFLIGTIVGAVSPTHAINLSQPGNYSLARLNDEARYADGEPSFLRALK